jgi:uncharacterized C2H2 Zn-finger protein
MDKFKCELCSDIFKSKFSLERHLNKKNKCDVVTQFQCKRCNKYFKLKKNLIEHEDKKTCNHIQKKEENEEDTKIVEEEIKENQIKQTDDNSNIESLDLLIKSDITDQKKIELINKYYKIEINDLLSIFECNLSIDAKIKIIHDFKKNIDKNDKPTETINNIQIINNTTNNTTNNIQINNFGNEKIDYLDNEYFKDLILNNHIQEAYKKLILDMYLHKDHPENHTIKNTNQYGSNAYVYENGKWRSIAKFELKEIMHEKNNKLLKIHYQRLKEFINKAKDSSIRVFFTRKFNADPYLIEVNKEMILFFYEGKDKV